MLRTSTGFETKAKDVAFGYCYCLQSWFVSRQNLIVQKMTRRLVSTRGQSASCAPCILAGGLIYAAAAWTRAKKPEQVRGFHGGARLATRVRGVLRRGLCRPAIANRFWSQRCFPEWPRQKHVNFGVPVPDRVNFETLQNCEHMKWGDVRSTYHKSDLEHL